MSVYPTNYQVSPAGLADAIRAGDRVAVEHLIETGIGANVDLPGGDTPLTLAADLGHVAMLRAVAARGAVLDRPACYHGQTQTALYQAVSQGHIECVRVLIELGCNIELGMDDEMSPLWWAAYNNHQEIVRLLLDAGADPYAWGPKSRTPLDRATRHGITAMELLLSAMHDPVKRNEAIIKAVFAAAWDENLYAIRALLDRAPNLQGNPDEHLRAGLIEVASARGNAELMRFVLSFGSCQLEGASRPNEHGETPLMFCVLKGSLDAVRVLVEAGANVRARETRLGYTPVMFACYLEKSEYPRIVDLLLEHGADIEARANDGRTAILLAIKSGLPGVVEALLRHGADLSVHDAQGCNVFDLAEARGDKGLIELLATRRH